MFKIIKTEKFDKFIELLKLFNLFVYCFSMVAAISAIYYSYGIVNFMISKLITVTFLVILFTLAYDFLRGKFLLIEIIIYGVLCLLASISYFNFKEGAILVLIFYLIAFKDIEVNTTLKVYVIAIAVGFLFNIFSGFLPGVKDFSQIQMRFGKETIRHTIGFSFYSFPSHFYCGLVAGFMMLKKKIKFMEIIIVILLNFILLVLTDTKCPFLAVIIAIFAYIVMEFVGINVINKFIYILTVFSFPIGTFFMYITAINYNSSVKFYAILNKLTTGRISLTSDGLRKWGFTMFGQDVGMNINPDTYNLIDSSYINILVQNGFIILLFVLLFFMLLSYLAGRDKNNSLVAVLLLIAFHSTFDTQLLLIPFNPTIFLFPTLFTKYILNKT